MGEWRNSREKPSWASGALLAAQIPARPELLPQRQPQKREKERMKSPSLLSKLPQKKQR
jgi:hypothetical protein